VLLRYGEEYEERGMLSPAMFLILLIGNSA
jgi:hypothetical protein